MLVEDLPAGQDIFYRVRFRDLSHTEVSSEPVVGRFRTAPADRRDVSFVWGGDVAGQGWGINPDDGGMVTFATMAKHRPDFLLHSGDTIYADGVIQSEVKLPDGKIWKNLTVPREGESRRDARRIPRRAQVQFSRCECARLQCRGADLRAMGRSRGDEQLVVVEGSPRRLQGAGHLPARRARRPRVPRDVSDAREHRRAGSRLSQAGLRAASGRLHAGRAQLSRPQRPEPADRLRTRQLFHRTGPTGLAEARAFELARHLESDRLRHAAQPHRL